MTKTPQIPALPGCTPLGIKPAPFKYNCTIRLGGYGADSLAELSAIYGRVRDASGEGASTFQPVRVHETGKPLPIGYIAYNGRIFAGRPQEWTKATTLLYDNRVTLGFQQRLALFLHSSTTSNFDQITAQFIEARAASTAATSTDELQHYHRLLDAIAAVAQVKFDGKWKRP